MLVTHSVITSLLFLKSLNVDQLTSIGDFPNDFNQNVLEILKTLRDFKNIKAGS